VIKLGYPNYYPYIVCIINTQIMKLENIRLHRDQKNNEKSFYWDVTTGKKVNENLIPWDVFTPEQDFH